MAMFDDTIPEAAIANAVKELKEAVLATTIKETKFNAGVEAAAKFNAGVEAADLKEDETIDEYTLSEKDLLGRAAIGPLPTATSAAATRAAATSSTRASAALPARHRHRARLLLLSTCSPLPPARWRAPTGHFLTKPADPR